MNVLRLTFLKDDGLSDFDDSLLDGLVSLQPFNTGLEFMYDEYRYIIMNNENNNSNK